eukprot:scaffold3922_cov175-Prasinococcus_capsulatus_cf.AAC.1
MQRGGAARFMNGPAPPPARPPPAPHPHHQQQHHLRRGPLRIIVAAARRSPSAADPVCGGAGWRASGSGRAVRDLELDAISLGLHKEGAPATRPGPVPARAEPSGAESSRAAARR